ncbi:MAG: hypothetical protein PWP24_221 [Clostridiales bacterium]|nr:hypothetical protein [Clostridiales bacterium]
MKVITMYLPQFHKVKENNEWWEEGYTEWTAVMRAGKQYESHNQPRIPLNNNYYNLLEHDVMLNQAILMEKYDVDVQCFYHYWFKGGRRILEKPAENLLQWIDINMPFCFCWANETWARSWSAVKDKNVWNDKLSNINVEQGSGILLEQDYGDENSWRQHFEYLLPFFMDNRYLKIENKPVFVFYKTVQIPCLDIMLRLWESLAKKNGFDGIYSIGSNANADCEAILDKTLIHEPQNITALFRHSAESHAGSLTVHDYDEIWKGLLEYTDTKKNAIYGGFVGYDDTPRRGSKGTVIKNQSPESFAIYFSKLLAKNFVRGNELVFLNAWNEWGEGMYLEADVEDGYSYLNGISYAKKHYKEYLQEFERVSDSAACFQIEALKKQNERYKSYWDTLDKWLCLKEKGVNFEEYFIIRRIKNLAIYGMGMVGRHLYNELSGGSIKVVYGIDQQGQGLSKDLPIYRIEDELPEADAVVIAVTFAYEEMVANLKEKGIKQIILLNEVLERL